MESLSSNMHFGRIRVTTNPKGMRVLFLIILVAVPLFAVHELSPLIDRQALISTALSYPEYRELRAKTRAAVRERGQVERANFYFPISTLVAVNIPISAIGNEDGIELAEGETNVSIRYDNAVLMIGIFVMLILAARTLLPVLTQLSLSSERIRLSDVANTAEPEAQGVDPAVSNDTPIVTFFLTDVANAQQRAEHLFARATLLLIGGIVMAFIGVAIFYITLPDASADEPASQYWPKTIRPIGVLIFVESIAWFLLRQYRSLIEDYKWFHRLYLKRANYLGALRLLEGAEIRPEEMYVAAALLNEDLTGKLRAGETTEALETQKLPDDNPIPEILRVISSIRREKGDASEPKEKKEGAV